jgi:hypothetical protein
MILPNGIELPAEFVQVALTPDYYIGLERYEERVTFIHCMVFGRWSPRVARELRANADAIATSHGSPIYAASHQPHNDDHAKWRKFVSLMGFEFDRTVRGTDGADHVVFVRRS